MKASNPTIDFYIGVDGVPVVHVDTPDDWLENSSGPVCRIYVNDDIDNPVFANPSLLQKALLESVLRDDGLADIDDYDQRVRVLEAQGMTRSDAQACADAELEKVDKPLALEILWGEDPVRDEQEPITYRFTTQAELTAFREGVEACDGWMNYDIVYTDEESS